MLITTYVLETYLLKTIFEGQPSSRDLCDNVAIIITAQDVSFLAQVPTEFVLYT